MPVILFQGDSITDAGRNREQSLDLGRGYPLLTAAHLGFELPGEYTFYNRGIGGNRIVDLYARIKMDIINLKPDVMSVLIGVNDVWHEINSQNGVEAAKFERVYDMLLGEVKEALPHIRLMLLEPFVLQGTATIANWDIFDSETKLRAKAVERLAGKRGAIFVPLQARFNEEAEKTSPDRWAEDGVHPTFMGHELIKREWLKHFK